MTENIHGSSESFDTPQAEVPNPSNTPDGSKSFYAPPSEETIVYDRRIADPNIAQEIATTERNLGVEAALRQEQALRIQSETGMTEQERRNQEIMDKLLEKYPDAFETMILEDGTKVIVLLSAYSNEAKAERRRNFGNRKLRFAFSKDGLISYRIYDEYTPITAQELAEISEYPKRMLTRDDQPKEGWIFPFIPMRSNNGSVELVSFCRGGLPEIAKNYPEDMRGFGSIFRLAQSDGVTLKRLQEKTDRKISIDEILGMLE